MQKVLSILLLLAYLTTNAQLISYEKIESYTKEDVSGIYFMPTIKR